MARFFASFYQRLSKVVPAVTHGPEDKFDEVDRYFLALRLASIGALGLWLWRLAAPHALARGGAVALAFLGYSVALYVGVWRRPNLRARLYLATLAVDLTFLCLICLWSAEPMSGVYLAFYLLVALHSFYFGPPVGIAAAAGFSALYTAVYLSLPQVQRISADELLLRLGFAFLVAISLGLVSDYLRANRDRLARVNREIQHRNRMLEQWYRHLSVGRLAGEVAHHINNPAAVIVSKAEVLRRQAERDALSPRYHDDLRTIADHAFQIAGVVRSLVALSPGRDGHFRNLDLAKVVQDVILLFKNRAAERRVSVIPRLLDSVRVRSQESPLRQIVVHLLCNALDAVDLGGEVVVETRIGSEPNTAELRVCDNGHGIPAANLDSVFSPFFTTKDDARGIGLGLSLSLAMARRLGGTITVDSAVGTGATFTVTLPLDSLAQGTEAA